MTIRKTLTAFFAAGMLLSQPVRAAAAVPIREAALQQEVMQQQVMQYNAIGPVNQQNVLMAFGLIYDYSVTARAGASGIYLTSRTCSRSPMKKIGLINIAIQYSTNNYSWTDVGYYSDILNSNSTLLSVTNKFYPVYNGAGYYRFRVTHYAYTNPLDPQKITQYSNSVKLYY